MLKPECPSCLVVLRNSSPEAINFTMFECWRQIALLLFVHLLLLLFRPVLLKSVKNSIVIIVIRTVAANTAIFADLSVRIGLELGASARAVTTRKVRMDWNR